MALKALYQQFNNPFTSLKARDYRIYWIFAGVSSIGIWAQSIALSWLVYRSTDSPLLLGIVNAVYYMPYLLFSLLAGVLIDRFSKRRLLIISHFVAALLALIMCLLIYLHLVQFWHVMVIAVLSGTVNVIIMPLRQVYIKELVDEKQLLNAVALFAAAYNLARIVGPALGGFIIAWLDIASCNLFVCICFLSMPVALLFIKTQEPVQNQSSSLTVENMGKTGLHYSLQDKRIRDIMYIIALIGMFGINFSVLLPVLSIDILDKGEIGFGLLMSAVGIGTFFGAFAVAASSEKGIKKEFLYQAPLVVGALLIFIGIYPVELFIYVSLALVGFFYVACSATASTALQLYSPPNYVGRIMSLYTLVLAGTSPFGNLYSGAISSFAGVGWGFIACGIGLILFYGIYFLMYKGTKQKGLQ